MRTLDFCEAVQVSAQDVAIHHEIHELAFARGFHQAGCFEFLDVMGQRCRADIVRFQDGTALDRFIASADLLEDLIAPRFRQGARNPCKLLLCQSNCSGGCHGWKLNAIRLERFCIHYI